MTDSPATRTIHDERGAPSRRVRGFRLVSPARTWTLSGTRVAIGSRSESDVSLDDATVSRLHAEITPDEHGFRLRDLGSTNGTFVDGVRVLDVYLHDGATIRVGRSELRFAQGDDERAVPAAGGDRFGPVVGKSLAMRELFAVLAKAAPTDATVLLEGETGTGKEVLARAIHEASARREGPLVVVDCTAVPANLLESELFGHEKGAFTGATAARVGLLEEADGGTLFLDELGELPLDLQPKLLRALEKRELRRVGGQSTISVDIRIVAATNRDLARAVNAGTFREDLYYRLAVVRIDVPPLRARREDVPLLVEHFVRLALPGDATRADRVLAGIRPENWQRLAEHPWPGNVRELRNVIERTLALSGGNAPTTIDPPTVRGLAPAAHEAPPAAAPPPIDLTRPFADVKAEALARFEEAYLVGQLDKHGGNISRAAQASGLDRMYFKRLLRKYRG